MVLRFLTFAGLVVLVTSQVVPVGVPVVIPVDPANTNVVTAKTTPPVSPNGLCLKIFTEPSQ